MSLNKQLLKKKYIIGGYGMIKGLYFILFFILPFTGFTQDYTLSGRITDTEGKGISFVSVYVKNTSVSTVANEYGNYKLQLTEGVHILIFRYVGFKQREIEVTIHGNKELNLILEPDFLQLPEVAVVSPLYDPARGIIKKVIDKRKSLLKESSFFSCDVYTKSIQKLIKAPKRILGQDVAKALNLDSVGPTILYQSETNSKLYLKSPDIKEIMVASKIAGDKQGFSFNRALDAQVNFYNNLLNWPALGKQNFVSPVADMAFSYYHYKLAETSVENGRTIYKIRVIPRYRFSPAFSGYVYVLKDEWRLYSVNLTLTGDTRINFVDTLKISQQFIPLKKGVWQPSDITFQFKGKVLGFRFAGYFIGVYSNYQLQPKLPWNFFNDEIMRIEKNANQKSSSYWAENRPVPLSFEEQLNYDMQDSIEVKKRSKSFLNSVQRKQNVFKPLKALIAGYQLNNLSNKSYWYFYPLQHTVFYNTVEGWGVNLRARYNKQYSYRRWLEIDPAIRYGFSSKTLNANTEVTYQYDTLNHASVTLKGGSDFLDLNNRGTINLFYNTLTTLFRGKNYLKLYRANFISFRTQRELIDGLQITAGAEIAKRMPVKNSADSSAFHNASKLWTSNNPFSPYREQDLFPVNNALTFQVKASYTYGQKYTTRPDGKVYEAARYPTIQLDYRKGIKNVINSAVDYDFLAVNVLQDQVRMGLKGYSSFYLSAGKFFNSKSVYFPDLKHFTGNQTALYNPVFPNFHFLDYYAFSTDDRYFEAHYEHNFSGLLTNKIPLLRKLKLEEIIGGAYLIEPTQSYKEAYFGFQRLMFRVDYGVSWVNGMRLNHAVRIYYGF
ncbi:DUF5686 and carboxypeptidase regulatory-like domain-containing protein [Rubrolithibacter danxiaensis]|uniref:DUF5686 and carboxypeptidase regulatory-like domain-containing protein n=1 Tax=Rubrolithibacter danxiaensis TaxID=3390805 RepID=UPI003BF8D31C